MKTKWVIAVVGATAIGKTRLAISLAKHLSTSIVSADSRQFYKEMYIGTAVPTHEELSQAQHFCIQHKSILDTYSVGDFEKEALAHINAIHKKNDVAIVVGGSGLYVDAITKGLDHFPDIPEGVRQNLIDTYKKNGLSWLQTELLEKDPEYYKQVDLDNPHRLIRALEVCFAAGKPYSDFRKGTNKKRPFNVYYLGIRADREVIYSRINTRVDTMMEQGLLEEVKKLQVHAHLNALNTVGYKELFSYLNDECSLHTAIEEIKKNTRRFAKRQLTWLRKNEEINWIEQQEAMDVVLAKVEQTIHQL